jgi:hypothetical protein
VHELSLLLASARAPASTAQHQASVFHSSPGGSAYVPTALADEILGVDFHNRAQAIARSHRIGQRKPVRVIHLETVADAPPDAVVAADDPDYAGDDDARSA